MFIIHMFSQIGIPFFFFFVFILIPIYAVNLAILYVQKWFHKEDSQHFMDILVCLSPTTTFFYALLGCPFFKPEISDPASIQKYVLFNLYYFFFFGIFSFYKSYLIPF
jgi:hypothetical protein